MKVYCLAKYNVLLQGVIQENNLGVVRGEPSKPNPSETI